MRLRSQYRIHAHHPMIKPIGPAKPRTAPIRGFFRDWISYQAIAQATARQRAGRVVLLCRIALRMYVMIFLLLDLREWESGSDDAPGSCGSAARKAVVTRRAASPLCELGAGIPG